MIQPPKDAFDAAAGENPLHTALQSQIEALHKATNYGGQEDCLEDITDTLKLLIDQNPADPVLAANLPTVIALLDENSLTLDLRAFDALEYAESAARRLESVGDDRLIQAVAAAAQKIAEVRGHSLTDYNPGPGKAITAHKNGLVPKV